MMTETSVIRHYKKQLIHRQHDLPYKKEEEEKKDDHQQHRVKIEQNGITDFFEIDTKNCDDKVNSMNNGRKTRKKRKNRNCRGQFRHEGMELIKLGTNTTHSLCKIKEPFNKRMEKTLESPPPKEELAPSPKELTNKKSVIQSTFTEKTIILENQPSKSPPHRHSLPQMVPERRNSKDMTPIQTPPTERRNSANLTSPRVPYSSPPHLLPPPPEYRVPIHPTSTHSLSYLPPPPFAQSHLPCRAHLPPVYTRSPPLRSVLQPHRRSPFQPVPMIPPPYPNIHFPYQRHPHYSNGYTTTLPLPNQNPQHDYEECRKRKNPPLEGDAHKPIKKTTPPVAIDLTVDQNHEKKATTPKHHKWHCECGKTYTSDPVMQDVIIKVANDKQSSELPTINLRGKLVNGVLKLESDKKNEINNSKERPIAVQYNETNGTEKKDVIKTTNPITKVPEKPGDKLPQLFLIKDLLAKGVRVEKKSSHYRFEKEILKNSQPTVISTKTDEKRPHCKPHRVIVSPNDYKSKESPKTKDHTVNNIIGKDRRQSADIDTISINSSSSESLRSPIRPKPDAFDKQIPHGKLFYYKTNNSFIRYFEDAQKKLFFDNLAADGKDCESRPGDESKEVIALPKNMAFSSKDSLTVEEYVNEMTLAEKFIPKDFFYFYKFVTGYQICHNNLPVSFLTFLKVYNTNGLKDLLERYVSSLKQTN